MIGNTLNTAKESSLENSFCICPSYQVILMCVCACLYMWVCLHEYVCVHLYMHVCLYVLRAHMYMCACLYVACVHVCIHERMSAHVCMCVPESVYV